MYWTSEDVRGLVPQYDYLLEAIDGYDVNKPLGPRMYQDNDNVVGHQQRAFDIALCIKYGYGRENLGLQVGSAGVYEPWTISTDIRCGVLPYYNLQRKEFNAPPMGGDCRLDCFMDLPFEDNTFGFLLANHVMEHCTGDPARTLRDWIRVVKPDGVLGLIMPAHGLEVEGYPPSDIFKMDEDHTFGWDAISFHKEVVEPNGHLVKTLRLDTLDNGFSFDWVGWVQ